MHPRCLLLNFTQYSVPTGHRFYTSLKLSRANNHLMPFSAAVGDRPAAHRMPLSSLQTTSWPHTRLRLTTFFEPVRALPLLNILPLIATCLLWTWSPLKNCVASSSLLPQVVWIRSSPNVPAPRVRGCSAPVAHSVVQSAHPGRSSTSIAEEISLDPPPCIPKREDLEHSDPANYRTIVNVSFLSKIIEEIVTGQQLIAYLGGTAFYHSASFGLSRNFFEWIGSFLHWRWISWLTGRL